MTALELIVAEIEKRNLDKLQAAQFTLDAAHHCYGLRVGLDYELNEEKTKEVIAELPQVPTTIRYQKIKQ